MTSINLKIDRILDLDEKQRLTDEFIKKSRELNELRNRGSGFMKLKFEKATFEYTCKSISEFW